MEQKRRFEPITDCDHLTLVRKKGWGGSIRASRTRRVRDLSATVAGRTSQEHLLSCAVSACIDYVTIERSTGLESPSAGPKVHIHGAHATIHDPSSDQLLKLKDHKIVRLEVAVDFRPRNNIPLEDWPRVLSEAHRHLSKYQWPFDESMHVRARYGATANVGQWSDLLVERIDEETSGTFDVELRSPEPHEEAIIGDRPGKTPPGQIRGQRPYCAQVKIYIKSTDNNQQLQAQRWRTRTEVTVWGQSLDELKLNTVADLLKGKFRSLRRYFFIVDPNKVLPAPRTRPLSAAGRERERLFRRQIEETGCRSLFYWAERSPRMIGAKRSVPRADRLDDLPKRYRLNRSHSDTRINRRILGALDNLSKRMRNSDGL